MSSNEVFPIKLPTPILVGKEQIYEFRNIDELISSNELFLEESRRLIEEVEAEGKKQDMVIDALAESVSLLAKRYGVE